MLPLTKADDKALMRHILAGEPYPPKLRHMAKIIEQAAYIPEEQREDLKDAFEIAVLKRIQEHRSA